MTPQRRALCLSLLAVAGLGLFLAVGGRWLAAAGAPPALAVPEDQGKKPLTAAALEARTRELERKLAALAPKGIHVVVDTGANRLYLLDGGERVREAVVSCGSGNVLKNPVGGQTWTFDTPRGEYQVESKVRDPVWMKPDWAYVEEGKEIPKKRGDRAERGVLGDYALGIGKGYFLHGTLYTRMLGRNVTHGCVRIGDKDLEALYRSVPMGTKVFLF